MPPSRSQQGSHDHNAVFASFVQEFARNMQATTQTIQELLDELKGHSVAMAVLKEQFSAMKENVSGLNQLIRNEEDEGSMITRIALMRSEVRDLREWRDRQAKTKDQEEKDAAKGKYAVWIAIVSAGAAVISQIMQWLLGIAGTGGH